MWCRGCGEGSWDVCGHTPSITGGMQCGGREWESGGRRKGGVQCVRRCVCGHPRSSQPGVQPHSPSLLSRVTGSVCVCVAWRPVCVFWLCVCAGYMYLKACAILMLDHHKHWQLQGAFRRWLDPSSTPTSP